MVKENHDFPNSLYVQKRHLHSNIPTHPALQRHEPFFYRFMFNLIYNGKKSHLYVHARPWITSEPPRLVRCFHEWCSLPRRTSPWEDRHDSPFGLRKARPRHGPGTAQARLRYGQGVSCWVLTETPSVRILCHLFERVERRSLLKPLL